jgi:hypothetical protein
MKKFLFFSLVAILVFSFKTENKNKSASPALSLDSLYDLKINGLNIGLDYIHISR